MRFPKQFLVMAASLMLGQTALAGEYDTTIPMHDKGAVSFYVPGTIDGLGPVDFMVDTGSSYVTLNDETLKTLKAKNKVRYVRDLRGRLANGSEMVVPIYSINTMYLGECRFDNIEAAVFPGRTRHLLGLSALSKAAPFVFSMDPAQLTLSHCTDGPGRDLAALDSDAAGNL